MLTAQHPFLVQMAERGPAILQALVRSSKDAVKKIDLDSLERKLAPLATPAVLPEADEASVSTVLSPTVDISEELTPAPTPQPKPPVEVIQAAEPAAPLRARLDTIKLSAQVAREQLDAYGGESALLRDQVQGRVSGVFKSIIIWFCF
jgi:hypothetical protein